MRAFGIMMGVCLFVLNACGFEPVHAKRTSQGATQGGLEQIQVVVQDDSRLGQLLKAELEDQLNPDYLPAQKTHILTISLTESIIGAFINPDGTASRNNVNYVTNYALTPVGETASIAKGSISRVSSYNVSERADYATYVSEQDAKKRAILEIARAYKLRLANVLAREENKQ
jgi:LPS-assembly lipoprotein